MEFNGLRYSVLALWLCLLVMTSSCGRTDENAKTPHPSASDPAASIRTGGIYRFSLNNNPTGLDPALVGDIYGITVVHQLFDGLVQFGPYLTVLPALAESWQVEEQGRLYRFFLRPGVRFHNGSEVTAADVAFSIKRLVRIDPPPAILPHLLKIVGAQAFRDRKNNNIEGLQIVNNHTLIVHLREPHAPFLTALGTYQAVIVPEDVVNRDPKAFAFHPIGSGPFKFMRWVQNEFIELEKYPHYYAGASFLDGIKFVIYPGGQADKMLSDFKSRNLEEMPVFGDIRQDMGRADLYRWYHRPSLSLFYYGMNCGNTKLKNPIVRKALSDCINRKEIVEKIYGGKYEIANTILPPGMPGYRPRDDKEGEDKIALPSSLPSSEGMPDWIEIACAFKSARVESEMELLRNYLLKIGVELKVKYITDWTEFENYLKSNEVQLYRYSWTADMPDPDSFLYPLFSSDSPMNFSKLKDDTVDTMLRQARAIIDPIERADMYHRIEARILECAPIIPLFYLNVDEAYQPYVQGLVVNALGPYYTKLHRVWFSEPRQPDRKKNGS